MQGLEINHWYTVSREDLVSASIPAAPGISFLLSSGSDMEGQNCFMKKVECFVQYWGLTVAHMGGQPQLFGTTEAL